MAVAAAHAGVTNPPNPTCVIFVTHSSYHMADKFVESTLGCPAPVLLLELDTTHADV